MARLERMERRLQQTMPEDRTGWRLINAGPHVEILFHPDRRPVGREPDQIERPSIRGCRGRQAWQRVTAIELSLSAWLISTHRHHPVQPAPLPKLRDLTEKLGAGGSPPVVKQ